MSGKQEYRMGTGASSILMIFVILSLTTLGVLAFASGRADLALTDRRSTQVQAYYAAAAEAQRIIAGIDEALLEAQADPEAYADKVKAIADGAIEVWGDEISFIVPVSPTQQIEVELKALGPDSGARYALRRHRLVNIAEWIPEEVTYVAVEDKERGVK